MKSLKQLQRLNFRKLTRKENTKITGGLSGLPSCTENCRAICLSDPRTTPFEPCFSDCLRINGC